MNYWIITTEFPPFHGGGISTYNLHSGLMLVEKGHQVTIFVPDNNIEGNIEYTWYEKIEVIRFKPGNKDYYGYLGYTAALSFQFSEMVLSEIDKRGTPDFIETQDYHGIGYYLILKKKLGEKSLQQIPLILTAHAPSFYYLKCNQAPIFMLPDYWTGEMEKWTMQAADILLSPSQYLLDNVAEDLNGKHEAYHVVRNPYKNLISNNSTKSFASEDIVFFGKLTYQKGCLQLLEFFSNLWEEGFTQKISFIGDDHFFEPRQINMKEFLIKKFQQYYDKGLFAFEGKLNLAQLDERLAKASLIIVPSLVDNFPYAVVESMLSKNVLLISDGGGQREMVQDGKSGFVYECGNYESFKEKFLKAITLTKEELVQFGENAQTRIDSLCNYQAVYEHKLAILNAYSETKSEKEFPFVYKLPKNELKIKGIEVTGRLSIVVPYFNTGDYIAETIQNIYEVVYPDTEVIVVNDGSTEPKSITILETLQAKFGFKVINQKNQGLASARNTGVKNSTGEFIAFLDADDKIHPDFYARAITILKQYSNLSFVSSWVQYFDSSNGIWPAQNPEPPYLLLANMVNAGFLCKKQDYLNFGLNDHAFEYGMEDYDANLSLMENGCRGVVIPEPIYYYRIHAASMARGFNKFNRLYLYRLLSSKHKGLLEKFAYQTYNLLLANGPSYLYDNPTLKPATDITEYRKRIEDLEVAVGWYDRTLKYKEQLLDSYEQGITPSGANVIAETVNDVDALIAQEQVQYLYKNYDELKQWYNKEYEVLPLWYKRVGHIIKAFQGKRSFKSLVKKEKV